MKIALYSLYVGAPTVCEANDYREEDKDYVRTTEIVEVDFVDLPKEAVVPEQVASIDARIADAKAEFNKTINRLETEKAKLLALEHTDVPSQEDNL